MIERYSEELDCIDASVFTGEMLFENLDEFQKYLTRWQKAVDDHKKYMNEEPDGEDDDDDDEEDDEIN